MSEIHVPGYGTFREGEAMGIDGLFAELDHMRFHDLRHTAGTIWLSQGVPVKVVSEMLGHGDVATTLRIYAHVIEGSQQQAVDVMDRLFSA